jgi:glycerol dehydrogenase-like iron-containing ADH family enzyme
MRYAYMSTSKEIMEAAKDFDGILSIGTGSVNDVCRYAASQTNKAFAIFATAPSMDGFASDSAPLIENNFKVSYPCRQPSVVIADTDILASSPVELKAAGFGDIIAKYIGILDWKIPTSSSVSTTATPSPTLPSRLWKRLWPWANTSPMPMRKPPAPSWKP